MLDPDDNHELPAIPGKRYFTIGEVSELCAVKPRAALLGAGIPQLKPVKRRGNRRYYQRHDVVLIRQIRSLLYVDGFTISGARNKLEPDNASGHDEERRLAIKALIHELEEALDLLHLR